MFLKIKKKIFEKIKHIIFKNTQNLSYQLAVRAANQTCAYIEKKMLDIPSQTTKLAVLDVAITATKTKGLILEFGVFSGETINHLSNGFPQQSLYGFDSFEGLPEFWRDGFPKGEFDCRGQLPKVNKNVRLIKGWYDTSLPEFLKEHPEKIAFLHIDCDLYSSTKTIFQFLASRIQKGTVIVFDEYFNYVGWQKGEFKAFQEFVRDYSVTYRYLTYNRMHEQVAVLIKSILPKK